METLTLVLTLGLVQSYRTSYLINHDIWRITQGVDQLNFWDNNNGFIKKSLSTSGKKVPLPDSSESSEEDSDGDHDDDDNDDDDDDDDNEKDKDETKDSTSKQKQKKGKKNRKVKEKKKKERKKRKQERDKTDIDGSHKIPYKLEKKEKPNPTPSAGTSDEPIQHTSDPRDPRLSQEAGKTATASANGQVGNYFLKYF